MTTIAILGAGFMGSTHARAYAKLEDVSIAAIYAQSGSRAEPLAAEVGSHWTADLESILADPSIDAVDICLPTPEHRSLLEATLGAGKHVLLEKPIALTLEDARAALAAAEAAAAKGQVTMIAHVLRFWPEYVKAQEIVASGELGKPLSAFASRRQASPIWSQLFSRTDLTGGSIVDQMIHDYDALNWVLGIPRTVMAHGRLNNRTGGYDHSQVLIGYDGASGTTDGGWVMPDPYPFTSRFEVLCEHGAVEYHFQAGGRTQAYSGGVNALTVYRNEGDPELVTVGQSDAYENEIATFVACVREGRQPTQGTPADALTALEVALAARESAETGTLITLDR
jgi:predicted dehydrogenase